MCVNVVDLRMCVNACEGAWMCVNVCECVRLCADLCEFVCMRVHASACD